MYLRRTTQWACQYPLFKCFPEQEFNLFLLYGKVKCIIFSPWRTNSPQLWIIAIPDTKCKKINIYLREEAAFQDSQWNLVDGNQYHLTNCICKVAQSTQRDPIFLQKVSRPGVWRLEPSVKYSGQTKTSQGPFVFQFCLVQRKENDSNDKLTGCYLRLLMRPVWLHFLSSKSFALRSRAPTCVRLIRNPSSSQAHSCWLWTHSTAPGRQTNISCKSFSDAVCRDSTNQRLTLLSHPTQ